jgi:hypothetical protein
MVATWWLHDAKKQKRPSANYLSKRPSFSLAGQNIRHHKPPKFLMDKQIKYLGSNASF